MIHPTSLIGGDTYVDPSCDIGPFCVIGSHHGPLRIRGRAIIRSHTVIEGGSDIGPDLETGHGALIRTGNTIGANLRLGTHSRLEGEGEIGDYVRIHGDSEMTKGRLAHFSRLYGGSYVTDNKLPPSDPSFNIEAVLDEGAVVCMNSVVIAGVTVGVGAFVGASTVVSRDVPAGAALIGRKLKPVTELEWNGYRYPWTAYYAHRYPIESRERIARLNERILAAAQELA